MIKKILLICALISVIFGIVLMCLSTYKLKNADKTKVQDVYLLHKKLLTVAEVCFTLTLVLGVTGIFLD